MAVGTRVLMHDRRVPVSRAFSRDLTRIARLVQPALFAIIVQIVAVINHEILAQHRIFAKILTLLHIANVYLGNDLTIGTAFVCRVAGAT